MDGGEKNLGLKIGYNIAVRRKSLGGNSRIEADLISFFDKESFIGSSEKILLFGPIFGKEAVDEYFRILELSGLKYYDDYFEFNLDQPSWVDVSVA